MNGQKRLAPLDGLRGAMSLWVLTAHTCTQTAARIPVLRSAHYAVDGFMILSGFLMAYHYLLRSEREPWTKTSTWTAFYIRRYFRISPLYYLLLIPSYLLSDSFVVWRTTTDHALGITGAHVAIQAFSARNLLLHLSYVFGVLPKYHASTVLPDWSLSLEMQFYILFPFFMLFVLRFGWLMFALAASAVWLLATVCAPYLAGQFSQPSPLPLSLLWFVIGMLWANAYLTTDAKNARRMIIFAAGLSLLSRDTHDIILVAVFSWILFAEGWFALGSSAFLVRRALSGRVSGFLADSSYAVYLLHLLIVTPTAYLLCTRLQLTPPIRFSAVLAITLVLSYGVAKPLQFIETWGIAWGKQLTRRLSEAWPSHQSLLPDSHPIHL